MKIGVSGAQSSGKTSLMQAIKRDPFFEKFEFKTETIRSMHVKGIPVNEKGTLTTQQVVISNHITNLYLYDDFVVDRTLLDGVVYTEYHYIYDEGVIPEWFLEYCNQSLKESLKDYDYLFYLPAEIPLKNDGFRSVNEDYRDRISAIFDKRVKDMVENLGLKNIYTVRGSIEERRNKVLNIVKGVKN